MNGYTKLFASILDSTVWQESKETRLVWVTLLAMADRDGIVDSSVPGLADRAKVTLKECEVALELFLSPDKYSRSKEHEGRRIEVIDGGWKLLNHEKYREKMSAEEQKERAALRQAKWRDKHKNNGSKLPKSKPLPGELTYARQAKRRAQEEDAAVQVEGGVK
jgi:hypothetical protein